MDTSRHVSLEELGHALAIAGRLIDGVAPGQWSASTPCTEWTVRELVSHVVGINLVFGAALSDRQPPQRGTDVLNGDPSGAYADSARRLLAACSAPGVLERSFPGPLGAATGAERLEIRQYDLLAHVWDLSRATGQPLGPDPLLESLAAHSLRFARAQLADVPRAGRFAPEQAAGDGATALDRLAAFLGRPVTSDAEH
ncbi:TIGR03086 family metal-binding protein [Zhihengliuella sp.]|uniref:TIGR03086 family metal-binding protein n=1 Tax=Zhihengliuella sp. TaxID=1954483 RepID=UPI002810C874|nr:TIGR03086 family metal-binding protein [Zhihengliuella sp.]